MNACLCLLAWLLPPPCSPLQVADVLRASGLAACTPVILLHSFGYLLGYGLPKMMGFNEKTARTGGV